MLVEVRQHDVQKVLQVGNAVLVLKVVQEAVVVAGNHLCEIDLLPIVEGLHQSLKLLRFQGPKVCAGLGGKEFLVIQ